MAVAELNTTREQEWLPANPWLWMPIGLGAGLLAAVWVNLMGAEATWVRLTLLAVGLTAAGAALAIRMNSAQPAYLDRVPAGSRSLVLGGLALIFAGMALVTLLLLMSMIFQRDVVDTNTPIPNPLTIVVASYVAWLCFERCQSGRPLDRAGETAVLLVLAGLCTYLYTLALYIPGTPVDWDSFRLALTVAGFAAMAAAALVLMSVTVRRVVVSLFLLFHFGGILTATMSAPPRPWVFGQMWARIYRPYLQFMYLNNAYHFYAPEPGPSCFIWFRVEFENDAHNKIYGWVGHPKIRKDGMPDYPFAVEYQRRLAMTDHVEHETPAPASQVLNAKKQWVVNPIYYYRQVCSDRQVATIEGKTAIPSIKVPFASNIPYAQQYRPPNTYSKKMIQSFAYHILKTPYAKDPSYKPVSVKVYKVVHNVLPPQIIAAGVEPTNPISYQPFYMGKYGIGKTADDKEIAKLLDEPVFDDDGNLTQGDPLLYWLLPMVPDNGYEPATLNKATIEGWVYNHAGDENWMIYPGELEPQKKKETPTKALSGQ